ncbi:hypothetical protein EVAR_8934_1 [Eumeta japonica]|uniref:ATP-dependent DNA helicase n=1 Tax=Eumeta variegata TaxID=151549 RepID=A0A4C1U145_EUMVA|nr:hypothetical protein EVAR_8934_1 [Eumeta japonica]
MPVCNISKSSERGRMLQQCKLLVWDECTMSHKRAIEALDRTIKDIKGNRHIMGGMVVLLADVEGDAVECLSVDNVMDTEQVTSYPIEFLNSLELSGVPSHKCTLVCNDRLSTCQSACRSEVLNARRGYATERRLNRRCNYS